MIPGIPVMIQPGVILQVVKFGNNCFAMFVNGELQYYCKPEDHINNLRVLLGQIHTSGRVN